MFDELRKTPFRSRKQKQGHAVKVEDGGSLGFAAVKDLQVSFEEDAHAEVHLNIQDLWVVPKRATRHADIGDVYGVGLEGEDEDSNDEDLEQPGEVAGSSSSDLRNPLAAPSTSSNLSEPSNLGDGTFGWSNVVSLHLMENNIAPVHVELCRV